MEVNVKIVENDKEKELLLSMLTFSINGLIPSFSEPVTAFPGVTRMPKSDTPFLIVPFDSTMISPFTLGEAAFLLIYLEPLNKTIGYKYAFVKIRIRGYRT